MIVDLGSSNGTRINGQKIVPNVNYPLKDGDIIALGRIKMQITIRRYQEKVYICRWYSCISSGEDPVLGEIETLPAASGSHHDHQESPPSGW